MNQLAVNDLSLVFAFLLVLIAVGISYKEKLQLSKDIFYSIFRAVLQLVIVGYVLKYIFQLDNLFLTAGMSLFIVFNAAWNAHKRNPNRQKKYWTSLLAIFVSTYVTLGVLVAAGAPTPTGVFFYRSALILSALPKIRAGLPSVTM